METGDLAKAVKRRAVAPPPSVAGTRRALWARALREWLRADWRGERYVVWGAALLALVTVTVAMYYAATPAVIRDPDSPTYLRTAHAITTGKLVDTTRLPIYPLFIDAVFLVTGGAHLVALGVAQAVVFVVAIMIAYALAALTLRRAWMAFIPAALTGANTHVISFVKPILTEGLTLFWVTLLGLALACYVLRPSTRRLWLVAAALTVTFMTRPEWIYFPVPLALFMLLLAWRAGMWRRLAPHLAGALAAMYGVALIYSAGNWLINGYFGVSDVQGVNLLGKVMQYHLTGDAPPRYEAVDRLVQTWVARGSDNPLSPIRQDPSLASDHYRLASGYATAMVLRHPLGFLSGVWGSMVGSLKTSLPFHPLPPLSGALTVLGPLDTFSRWTLSSLVVLLPIVVVWWALLLWPRSQRTPVVSVMSGLSLMVMYDLTVTTAGSYWYYPRMHTPFDPLLLIVVAGSLALASARLLNWARSGLRPGKVVGAHG